MRLLTDNDRNYILAQLAMAPDSVLADAMLAFDAIRNKIVAVRKIAEGPIAIGVDAAIPGSEKTVVEEVTLAERANVSPGVSSITKIGSNTKIDIIACIDRKQIPAKYTEHLKLMWARGEVKYDGKEWYL